MPLDSPDDPEEYVGTALGHALGYVVALRIAPFRIIVGDLRRMPQEHPSLKPATDTGQKFSNLIKSFRTMFFYTQEGLSG